MAVHPRSPIAAVSLILLPLGLAGCSVLDPQPLPDAHLAALAATAQADRPNDAAALRAEMIRVCGHREDGSVPESCSEQAIDATISSSQAVEPAEAAGQVEDLFFALPEQSRLLVAQMYTTLPASSDVEVTPEPPALEGSEQPPQDKAQDPEQESESDWAAALRTGLEEEYELLYGLDVARAFADPATTARIDRAHQVHTERVAQLQELLSPTGDVPAALPAYAFAPSSTVPVDQATAAIAVDELLSSTSSTWANIAAEAKTEAFASYALRLSAAGGENL
ncbi:ferritin-like domain-containing protein [Corynebacterium sp. 35RC1]|nr:ferritin-like domain-containing protein [Corynebacterium sp. 35RC1]